MGRSVACPPSVSQLKEKVVCGLERKEREEGGEYGPLFSNCVFMSPLTVSVPQHFTMEAIVCLGEKAWVFCFNHFLKVLCLTRWGLSTSCGWRQACSLCPFPCLSTGICPLCPLCHPLNAPMFTLVEIF